MNNSLVVMSVPLNPLQAPLRRGEVSAAKGCRR